MGAPLSGIRILDFSTLLPGPMASLLLAEAGADVIKIERPGTGDEIRSYEPKWGDDSVNFAMLNRGKKSLGIDLKDPTARRSLEPLIKEADVVIEQFRPGVMSRLQLGYDDMRKIKPDIIYCAITGYGQTGDRSDRAGHDLNYVGDCGLLALSMGDDRQPVVPPALIADIAGGAYPAVINILLALRARDLTGEGVFLDIAMTDNLFPFMFWAIGNGQATGQWPGNGDALLTGGSPRYQLYPTRDGEMVAAAPLEQKFWEVFCDAIGLDQVLRNDQHDPNATRSRIADIIAGKPADHWRSVFQAADCCCSIVQSIEQAMKDPHFRARGLFGKRIGNGRNQDIPALPLPIAPPFRDGSPASAAAPRLAEHNDDLLPVH